MRPVLGVFLILAGVALGGWIFYNLFIERLPETQGRRPFAGIGFTIGLLYVGYRWVRGEQAD